MIHRTESNLEVEIKLRISSAQTAENLLSKAGFSVSVPRSFERNTVFDNTSNTLRNQNQLLRLRKFRGRTIITFKNTPIPGPHKQREELEIDVNSEDLTMAIFARLGYRPLFRYEKYRTTYGASLSPGEIVLDETPIGVFLELEGPRNWIDETARALGFSKHQYITDSYATLYFNHCKDKGITPTDFVF
jgi:adenylate cyclase class 2